jgi:hypothetical protein
MEHGIARGYLVGGPQMRFTVDGSSERAGNISKTTKPIPRKRVHRPVT